MRTRKHPRQRGEAVTRAPRGERRRGGGGESRAAHLSPGKRATTKGRNLPSYMRSVLFTWSLSLSLCTPRIDPAHGGRARRKIAEAGLKRASLRESRSDSMVQETVVFQAGPCCGKMPTPAFPASLAQAGVLEEDYMRLVNKVSETEAAKIQIGLPIALVTGGICVCVIILFGCELNGEIDAFNSKYKDKDISVTDITRHGGGGGGGGGGPFMLLFNFPSLTVAHAVPVAPEAAQMARDADDPVAKIEMLTTMLEKGLLSQAEFDAKKAEVLARM